MPGAGGRCARTATGQAASRTSLCRTTGAAALRGRPRAAEPEHLVLAEGEEIGEPETEGVRGGGEDLRARPPC